MAKGLNHRQIVKKTKPSYCLDCKTVRFFSLKIIKEISVWRESYAREAASCMAVSPQSHSPFSASFQTFCLTARAYLNTQKYGLFCSLLSVLPICSKQALILLIADCFQNGNPQDPNCNGIHGVLAAYYHSIERVQLHGNISDLKGLLGPVYKGRGGYPGDRVTPASWLRITLGELLFTWENRKFRLENQMVRAIPFGKPQETWTVI